MKRIGMVTAAVCLATGTTPANAAVTVTIDQVGSDVVASTSGSLDLSGLSNDDTFFLQVAVWGQAAYIATGEGPNVTGFFGFTGPDTFGGGPFTNATSSTGDGFAINGAGFGTPYVFVPTGYVDGTPLASTSLFAGATIASLGLDTGTYVWTLPADTVTVTIGAGIPAAVPEPVSWALALAGFGVVGAARRRRRHATAVALAA